MTEIVKSRLEKAERDLRSIADRHSGAFKDRDIDWRKIREELHRLDEALENGDGTVFSEALATLIARLGPPNTLRGHIGSDSGQRPQAMPPQVLELINHMVDRLDSEIARFADSPQADDGKKRSELDDGAEK